MLSDIKESLRVSRLHEARFLRTPTGSAPDNLGSGIATIIDITADVKDPKMGKLPSGSRIAVSSQALQDTAPGKEETFFYCYWLENGRVKFAGIKERRMKKLLKSGKVTDYRALSSEDKAFVKKLGLLNK